jgi:hypothetical protein
MKTEEHEPLRKSTKERKHLAVFGGLGTSIVGHLSSHEVGYYKPFASSCFL